MKISKSTIVRTILVVLVIVNSVLEKCGVDLIPSDEYTITMILETLIEIAIILAAWWKNNSFSEKAKKADEFLKKLKNDEEIDVEEYFEGEVE